MKLNILVPIAGSHASKVIAPASAIVSSSDASGERVLCHYEGNLFNAQNLESYFQRLISAGGRLASNYPTAAMGEFDPTDFIVAGTFDWARQGVTQVFDADGLAAWAGEPIEAIAGTVYPPGQIDWAEGARAVQARGGPVHGRRDQFRTLAGQIIAFDAATQRAEVLPDPVEATPSPDL
jgi:hypothetical protein